MMKKIVIINGINYGSTGNIAISIGNLAKEEGYDVYSFFRNSRAGNSRKQEDQYFIGTWLDRIISERLSYIFGLNGYFNIINTHLFIKKLDEIKPNLIHIHNLCDNYLNINMLFKYLAEKDIPVIWTFHDSWPFTGRCAKNSCEKWKEGCGNCPHKDYYPSTLIFDNSKEVLKKRTDLYNKLNNFTIVTPSKWLANQCQYSLFKDKYPVRVINNGIDLNIFKPTESEFKTKYNLQDKYILLSVAAYWDYSKGLDVLIELAKRLPEQYQIVIVGTNEDIDKQLPENIISIHKTSNQKELVEIYSSADLFVNPTRDENYPTVNMEALACGTPVITFETGGSPEIINDKCGKVVKQNDIDELEKQIIYICENKPYKKETCLRHAKNFDKNKKFKEYIKLYKELI